MLNQYQTVLREIEKHNKTNPIIDALVPYVRGKDEVVIADIGAGPFSIMGRIYRNTRIYVYASDTQNFNNFYAKYGVTPRYPIEYQNMEQMTYPDNVFDIVYCANALDHTKNAQDAVKEMIRICKPGGVIYIDCALMQRQTGHKHFWDAHRDGLFSNGTTTFSLRDFGFTVRFVDSGLEEERYNHIIATMQKHE